MQEQRRRGEKRVKNKTRLFPDAARHEFWGNTKKVPKTTRKATHNFSPKKTVPKKQKKAPTSRQGNERPKTKTLTKKKNPSGQKNKKGRTSGFKQAFSSMELQKTHPRIGYLPGSHHIVYL